MDCGCGGGRAGDARFKSRCCPQGARTRARTPLPPPSHSLLPHNFYFTKCPGGGGVPGDGTIAHAGAERIVEAYYCWHPSGALLGGAVAVTVDYQLVVNPAYNRDRGPAHVLGLRVHWGV